MFEWQVVVGKMAKELIDMPLIFDHHFTKLAIIQNKIMLNKPF